MKGIELDAANEGGMILHIGLERKYHQLLRTLE